MKSSEIREKFLKYFEGNGHKRLKSSPLVPANDPTLFFTNAGMVQFKDVFLGRENRGCNRATTSQKCMRVSGKHNDLEQVGMTPRHHTFFEMLGNFSFGDYFKKEAIAFAWEFLTKTMDIPKDRLCITIFDDDNEAEKLWTKHVEKGRIFRLGEKDNFWAMGETGPCGPCSEIHYDRNPGKKVVKKDMESDRFMEIWNLVFMQFERGDGGKMKPLGKPSIDTGMGLERLASVMQGTAGNYETDLFTPIITEVERVTGKKYSGIYNSNTQTPEQLNTDFSIRVIADHIRAGAFLIGDGVQPSNEGRGYVLRRIVRRAIRHGKMLGQDRPFFAPIARVVIDEMGGAYPELIQHKAFIEKVLKVEEERFYQTLDNGLKILDEAFAELKKRGAKVIGGDVAFKLYDTFGFPKDLTIDIAREHNFGVDEKGFEKCMSEQREKARSAWKGSGEEKVDGKYKELEAKGVRTKFVGYETESAEGKVLMVSGGQFITDVTPFYGDSGGQVGDTGAAVGDGLEIAVTSAKRPLPGIIVHEGKIVKGELKVGQRLTLAVDSERRADIKRNHSATHLLHKALRETLGEHVKQAGSHVAPDRLRFDFSHFQAMTDAELKEVEAAANNAIRKNTPVVVEELAYDDAVARGALAFFGEKYGAEVRMVAMGDYSIELCGGTHVSRTGDIGMVKIIGESSVASGVRRIEAVTGRGVEEHIAKIESELAAIASEMKVGTREILPRIRKLAERVKQLEHGSLKQTATAADIKIVEIKGVRVAAAKVDAPSVPALRSLSDQYKQKIGSGIVVLAAEIEGKVSIIVTVSADLVQRYKAGDIVKKISAIVGGTGGGRPDMAQGGGPDVSKLDEALKSFLAQL